MPHRSLITLVSLCIAAAACGDDGGTTTPVDAPVKDIGFNKPTAALKGNNQMNGTWMELGPADLSCLNTPTTDRETSVAVTLNTTVTDFQSGNPVPSANVTVFRNADVSQPFDTKAADSMAKVSFAIPTGVKRFGFKMTQETAMDTLLLNQIVAPDMPIQMFGEIQSVSKTTATTLSAFIGISRTPGTGVLAGAVRDCAGDELSNFIATVSKTKGAVDHVDGSDSYYFSESAGLPVRHSLQAAASKNGLFMVIELAPTATGYVQVWGYKTDADLASDTLSLIAELQAPVIADTVITGSYEPLRTP